MNRRLCLSTILAWLSCGLILPTPACGDAETTTGKRVDLRVVVTAEAARASFATAAGWQVSLSRALLSLGPQYYNEGATIFTLHRPAAPLFDVRDWLSIRTAYAHPGHYVAGNARGEFLSATSIDLVSGSQALGSGSGTTGMVRSGSLAFQSPAQGPFAQALGANVLVLEGRATKGNESHMFSAALSAADVSDTGGVAEVVGCAFQETEIKGNGTVTLAIDVAKWFELVEFERLPASQDAVALEGVAKNELVRGVRAGDRYRFSFVQD